MKFIIKCLKIKGIYDNKFLQTRNGNVYKLVYNDDGNYSVLTIDEDRKIVMSDLHFEYINNNLRQYWKIHDENPNEK